MWMRFWFWRFSKVFDWVGSCLIPSILVLILSKLKLFWHHKHKTTWRVCLTTCVVALGVPWWQSTYCFQPLLLRFTNPKILCFCNRNSMKSQSLWEVTPGEVAHLFNAKFCSRHTQVSRMVTSAVWFNVTCWANAKGFASFSCVHYVICPVF